MTLATHLADRLRGTQDAIDAVRLQLPCVTRMAECVLDCLAAGGTLYTCGNGGSAAEATHLSEELVGRYRGNRRPLPAVSLCIDGPALTCIANDFGFDEVFARQCEALLTEGDALVALSTSGKSPNIVRALEVARARGATTIGLLGQTGGPALALCDESIVIEGTDSAPIQEAHLVVVHLLCEAVEIRLGAGSGS